MKPYQHVYLRVVSGVRLRGRARPLVFLASFGKIRDTTRGGALWLSTRHHMTTPTGLRLRGFQERPHQPNSLLNKGELEEVSRRRQPRGIASGTTSRSHTSPRDRGGVFSWTRNGRRAAAHGSLTDSENALYENAYASRNSLAEPRYTFWQSFRRSSRDKLPLNPLHKIQKWDDHAAPSNPTERSTSRFLLAVEEMFGKAQRRGEKMSIHLSEDQRHEIVARYTSTKWWGRFYYPFRNISDRQIRWSRRISRLLMVVALLIACGIIFLLYFQEVRVIELLSPEDRRDYIHIVNGMRYGEIKQLADEVLAKEDPLMALPAQDRCHLFLEAARERNWHLIDWEVESRSRYPRSALDDFDWMHITYWLCMTVGSTLMGSSTYFTDALGLAERTRKHEAEFISGELEPKALPERAKRGFW